MARSSDDLFFARRKPSNLPPFSFVLDELSDRGPWTRPMFGSTAVYIEEKIVFVLRDKKADDDNGVWLATTKEHHPSLRRELPSMRSIHVLGTGETSWQILPVDADDFEDSVLRACALVRAGDARIGKVPNAKKPKAKKTPKARKTPKAKKTPRAKEPRAKEPTAEKPRAKKKSKRR